MGIYKTLKLDQMAVEDLIQEIEEGEYEFVPKEICLRILENHRDVVDQLHRGNRQLMLNVARGAREDGLRRATALVENMAEEIGDPNLLHAVALALRNMELPE